MQATQIGIQGIVPVSPVAISQSDKEINIQTVFCQKCDTEWQTIVPSRCPCCACCVGTPIFLSQEEKIESIKNK